jgi:hypothetical protein
MQLWYFTASPSQQSRCSEIGSPLWGEFGRIFLGDIQGKWKKIRFVEKYCNMQIIEKVDYRIGQIYE